MSINKKTIKLDVNPDRGHLYYEGAVEAGQSDFKPGTMMAMVGFGDTATFTVLATDVQGDTPAVVATEHGMIGETVEDTISATDKVFVYRMLTGEIVNARLDVSQTIVAGDKLTYGTAGALAKAVSTDIAQFEAIEAVTSGASDDVLIAVRAILPFTVA